MNATDLAKMLRDGGVALPYGFRLALHNVSGIWSIQPHHVMVTLYGVQLVDANSNAHEVTAVRMNGKGKVELATKGEWVAFQATAADSFVEQVKKAAATEESWTNFSVAVCLPGTGKVTATETNGRLVLRFPNQRPTVDLPGPLKSRRVVEAELTDGRYRVTLDDGSQHGGEW